MPERYAYRTIRLCTKDCLCLYVCPTGATDTENSIIDKEKCTGCGACADACPGKAISLVPKDWPAPQKHTPEVVNALHTLCRSKTEEEAAAAALPGRLAKAVVRSSRLTAEDIMHEAGFMLPQSEQVRTFLQELLDAPQGAGFPREAVEKLLVLLEPKEDTW